MDHWFFRLEHGEQGQRDVTELKENIPGWSPHGCVWYDTDV